MRRGFTLIELLAAMAILAVVSVMAVQALSGVFQQRTVLTRVDDRAAALIRTLSLLRQDLEAALPVPTAGRLSEAATAGVAVMPGRLAWLRGGLADLPGDPTPGVGAVIWAVTGTSLTRSLSRDLVGGGATSALMLDGVTAITLVPLGLPETGDPDQRLLAPGYEVTVETEVWGTLRLVVAR